MPIIESWDLKRSQFYKRNYKISKTYGMKSKAAQISASPSVFFLSVFFLFFA